MALAAEEPTLFQPPALVTEEAGLAPETAATLFHPPPPPAEGLAAAGGVATLDIALLDGVPALRLTPAAPANFRISCSSRLRSFSLRFSMAAWLP